MPVSTQAMALPHNSDQRARDVPFAIVGSTLWPCCVTFRPMLALAMLSLTCLGDACTYRVLTRCGTEYRAPQKA